MYFVISNQILSDFSFCIKLAHIASAVFLVCNVYISLSLICNELIHNSVTRTQYKIHALYNSTNMATMWTCYFLLNESFMAQYETWIKYQWSYSISLAYKKDCGYLIANALELLQYCTWPSVYILTGFLQFAMFQFLWTVADHITNQLNHPRTRAFEPALMPHIHFVVTVRQPT